MGAPHHCVCVSRLPSPTLWCTMNSYSLLDVVRDGPLVAPRWVHHLVKIATAVLAAWVLNTGWSLIWHQSSALWATIWGGPVFWAALAVREHYFPTDPTHYTMWLHICDWVNDCALATVPVAAALLMRHDTMVASVLSGGIVVAYLGCHRNARP